MKVLVISAHPDDLEIACSGTLKRLQDLNASIISVITVKPSEEINVNRSKDIVSTELKSSYILSGFELRILNTPLHPNGRPNLQCNNNTMSSLLELLEPCDIAIIPNPHDSHQDHRTTYELALPLVQKLANEVWVMESYPYCLTYTQRNYNLYYDITEQWEFKQSLLACYSSYFEAQDIEKIQRANQWWGLANNTNLAEVFTVLKKHVR